MTPARVVLKPRRARPFFARHPWLYAGSIARVEGDPPPGAEVVVTSFEGQFVARGLFNPHSSLRVRLYRWEDEPLDDAFWRSQIDDAVSLRRDVLRLSGPESAARIVFSEADGLSGLTVDRYDRWLVAHVNSLALIERRASLLPALLETTGTEGAIVGVDPAIATLEGLAGFAEEVIGSLPDGPIGIVENGLRFEVDLRAGQKTGFFLDQRDNRRAVAAYAEGREVLDLFCYTGGFALNALQHGGATHVLAIDSSAPAIELARRNAVANHLGAVRFESADAFATLENLKSSGRRFGLVICDPPKFARNARDVDDALKGYLRLNRLAVDVVDPGGVLATCSCSGLVDRRTFADILARVAELSGRPIRFLEQRGQAADHPVAATCLESDYLKCVIARVG